MAVARYRRSRGPNAAALDDEERERFDHLRVVRRQRSTTARELLQAAGCGPLIDLFLAVAEEIRRALRFVDDGAVRERGQETTGVGSRFNESHAACCWCN